MNCRHESASDGQGAGDARRRQCLVVAGDLSHRLLLSQAAQHVGWQTIEAATAADGRAGAARAAVDLAIVDLAIVDLAIVDLAIVDLETADLAIVESAGFDAAGFSSTGSDQEGRELRELVERLAADRNRLVMVCGNHRRPEEEIWARQLGVWIYVPGLDDSAYQDGADVTALCSHAAEIVDRWLAASEDEICREKAIDMTGGKARHEQRTKE